MKCIKKKMLDNKGAAAVEFGLLLPLLIVIIFGIIEFGLLLYDKQVVTNASREGARAGIVWDPDGIISDGEIEAVVNNYCSSYLVTFGAGGPPTTSITRSGANSGDTLTVTVTYDYDFLLLPNFVPGLPGITTLNAVTVMRQE